MQTTPTLADLYQEDPETLFAPKKLKVTRTDSSKPVPVFFPLNIDDVIKSVPCRKKRRMLADSDDSWDPEETINQSDDEMETESESGEEEIDVEDHVLWEPVEHLIKQMDEVSNSLIDIQNIYVTALEETPQAKTPKEISEEKRIELCSALRHYVCVHARFLGVLTLLNPLGVSDDDYESVFCVDAYLYSLRSDETLADIEKKEKDVAMNEDCDLSDIENGDLAKHIEDLAKRIEDPDPELIEEHKLPKFVSRY